jgi:ABC-type spermidine/putrescine transport system permease subunit II
VTRQRLPRASSVFAALVFAALYAPIVLVLVNSFNGDGSLIGWGGFTTRWYDAVVHDGRVRDDFGTSLVVATLSTAISLVIAVAAGLWARSASDRGRRLLEASTYVRIVLPEIVFALGLFLLANRLHLKLGVATIVMGHVVFNSAYATIIVQARFATLNRTLEEAAADLGAPPWRVFRRITLPLLAPAIVVAGLLTFTFSFDDVIVSQFLGGTNAETLPVLLLGKIRLHVTPEVNAIGAGVMLITLVSFAMAALVAVVRPTGAGALLGLGRRAATE